MVGIKLISFAIFYLTMWPVLIVSHPVIMIDLTYEFSRKTPSYPTHTKFESQNFKKVYPNPDKDIKFAVQDISGSEHAGTHMDSPFHFNDNGITIEQIPIEYFTGPAVVINITERAQNYPDATVTVEDLEEWEKQHGRIPDGSIILQESGWHRYWEDMKKFLGNDNLDPTDLHYPGFSEEACQWLCDNRSIYGIGVDTAGLDVGATTTFPCHYILSERNLIILENIANMEKMPPVGAIVRAYPMKIRGGTGAPTRVIATLNNPQQARSNAERQHKTSDEL